MAKHLLTVTFTCDDASQADHLASIVELHAKESGLRDVVVKQRQDLAELLGLHPAIEEERLPVGFDRVMDSELDQYGHYPD